MAVIFRTACPDVGLQLGRYNKPRRDAFEHRPSACKQLSMVALIPANSYRGQPRSRQFHLRAPFFWGVPSKVQERDKCHVSCTAEMAEGATGQQEASRLHSGMGPAIEVDKLMLNFEASDGEVSVLKGCTLAVPRGELWMLLGPNGCGKSTLLKALAGLVPPSGGRLRVASPRSFVFQNPDHQVVMPTVGSDVAFGLGHRRVPEPEVWRRVESSLAAVGMADYIQRAVHTLSGGQKQRVAIAGALAEDSRVLLLDELTTFLDESDQIGVLEAVRRVVGGPRGVTALWVTHRLEELAFADGAIYMEDGQVVIKGKVEDVKAYIGRQQREAFSSVKRW